MKTAKVIPYYIQEVFPPKNVGALLKGVPPKKTKRPQGRNHRKMRAYKKIIAMHECQRQLPFYFYFYSFFILRRVGEK